MSYQINRIMSIHKDINLFSEASIGKTVFYHGSILPDLDQGDSFNVTDDTSSLVYRIGYGASSVNLINEDVHVTLLGSSRLINESFSEMLATIDDFEVEEIVEESVFTQSVGSMGPVGPRGEQGEQGFPGIPGRNGNDGKDGIDGDQGEKGEPGERGADGQQGPQGEHGIQGEQGPQGERGPQGDQGVQGELGPQGEQGSHGDHGEKGEQGVQGEQGSSGIQGSQGEKGEQGSQGEQGVQGLMGPSGKNGKDGKQGPKGDKGDRGELGKQGERGEDGIANVAGPLRYDTTSRTISVSEDWINSLGTLLPGNPIIGGGGDLFGVKKDGSHVPFGNVVRYIDFRGSGITVSADGVDAVVSITTSSSGDGSDNALEVSGGNNIMSQFLDMNGFDIYNARVDGGTF